MSGQSEPFGRSQSAPVKTVTTALLAVLGAIAHACIILIAGSMSYQSVVDKLNGEETARRAAIEQLSQLETARGEAINQHLDHLERQVDDMLAYLRHH